MPSSIPKWKAKALAQKLLWHMPGGVGINERLSRLGAGHDAAHELLAKHAPNFFRQSTKLQDLGLKPDSTKTFMEIGTGWDLDVAWLARLCGYGRAVTVDAFRHLNFQHIETSLGVFSQLTPEISRHSLLTEQEITARISDSLNVSGSEFANWAGIDYIAPISRSYKEVKCGSCDVIYSTAVFEHIYVADVKNILRQIRRILKPSGFTTHVIDLKDHFAYFQSGLSYNNFLRFSETRWQYWTGNPLSFTNRLLVSDWERLFAEAGLQIVFLEEVREMNMPRLPERELHSDFRSRSERDLATGEIHVVARIA